MNHQHDSTHGQSTGEFIFRHVVLLIIAILILGGLYLLSQNLTVTTLGAVALVAVHIIIVAGVLFSARSVLRRLMQRVHGTSGGHAHDNQGHTHSHNVDLETSGVTISWARLYDLFVNFLLMGQQRKFREGMLKLARIQPGEKVLDVGCGTGTVAIMAKQGAHPSAQIHALDAAPEMIDRAREKAKRAGVDVDFQPGLVEAIHFPDDTFDLVMNSLMVHHLPPELKSKAFAEMYRVLRPGGRLLIVDFEPPKGGLLKVVLTILLGQMTGIDNGQIPPLLRATGFKDVTMGSAGSRLATHVAGIKPVV